MKITVPSAGSVTLTSLLTPAQIKQASASKVWQGDTNSYRIVLQNLHATLDFYIENSADAVVAESVKVQAQIGTIDIRADKLDDINLISDGSDNDEVRVIFH